MVSIKSLFTGALIAAVAVAQSINSSFTPAEVQGLATGSGGPQSPSASDKVAWCKSQRTLCSTLCNSDANNTCMDSDLSYTCGCPNGTAPPLQYYPFSIIGNECHALNANCKALAPNASAIDQCDMTYICGNATQADASAAASAAAQATMTSSATPSATSAAPASSSAPAKNAAAPFQTYAPGMAAMAVLGAVVAAL